MAIASVTVLVPRSSRVRTPIWLTRRGVMAVRAALVLVLAVGLVMGFTAVGRSAGATPAPAVSYRVVLPGETLWSIAAEVAPRADRRDTIATIVRLNRLPDSGVLAGQRIAVPAG